jgi:hypothetical protein
VRTEAVADRPVSEGGLVHAMPWWGRAGAWLAAAAGIAVLVAAYAAPYLVPGSFDALYLAFPASIPAGLLALFGVRTALRMRERFSAGAAGLSVLGPGGASTLVRWEDVASVRQRPWLQRLEVADRSGRTVFLEYQLTDFDRLAATVAGHAAVRGPGGATRLGSGAERDDTARHRSHFHAGRARWALPALVPVVVLASIAVFGGVLFVAWALAIGLMGGWLVGWSEIRLEDGALVVHRPFRTRRIPSASLAAVELIMEEDGHHQRPEIAVLLDSGEVMAFSGVREGELQLYAALRRMMEPPSAPTGAPVERTPAAATGAP